MILDHDVNRVASALYESLNTPRALTAAMLLKYKEWDQLVDLTCDPRNYLEGCVGSEMFRKDIQASSFLRKYPGVPLKRNLVKAAEETFEACENRCFQTNEFLRFLRLPPLVSDDPVLGRMRDILSRARQIAKRILGPVPDCLDGAFGPGTSFELKGSTFSTLADKLHVTPTTTPECAPVFEHIYWPTLWGRSRMELGLPLPGLVRGNRFSTVAKDSTKRRGICIEPLGNLFCQLGIGRYLKRRLSGVGILVDREDHVECPIELLRTRPSFTGQDLHRMKAQVGSAMGGWATLDLSNASDTVSFELVRDVLPPDWFELLCACRSPYTLFRKKWRRLEKFSSMGNGFTFELETLLFLCLIAAESGLQVGTDLFCYGDDILIPERRYRDASAVLEAFGFEVNQKKSFHVGPFRESCGGDFFSGYNVRPVFVKDEMDSPLRWCALHNEIVRRWGSKSLASKRCLDAIPTEYRVGGPRKLGHQVFWERRSVEKHEDDIRWTRVLRPNPTPIPLDRWGGMTLALALLGVPSSGIVPRGPTMTTLGWYSVS